MVPPLCKSWSKEVQHLQHVGKEKVAVIILVVVVSYHRWLHLVWKDSSSHRQKPLTSSSDIFFICRIGCCVPFLHQDVQTLGFLSPLGYPAFVMDDCRIGGPCHHLLVGSFSAAALHPPCFTILIFWSTKHAIWLTWFILFTVLTAPHWFQFHWTDDVMASVSAWTKTCWNILCPCSLATTQGWKMEPTRCFVLYLRKK
jgi:hypothetical protein